MRHLKSRKKARKHELRRTAHVISEFKLAKVFAHVLTGHMNVSALDAALDLCPITFERINVVNAINPLLRSVFDRAVRVAEITKRGIRREFIAADGAALSNLRLDDGVQRFASNVRDNVRHNVTGTLQHTENGGLASGPTSAFARMLTANIGVSSTST